MQIVKPFLPVQKKITKMWLETHKNEIFGNLKY